VIRKKEKIGDDLANKPIIIKKRYKSNTHR
jgi:hypothetical protein